MTLPVIGKVFGWVISTRLVKSKSETKSSDPAVPCVISSTVQFVFYCSSFPVCVPECSQWSLWKCLEAPEVGPTSAKNPKSNTATFDQFPPVLDHKSFLDPIPAFVAWIISNHQKKKLHLLLLLGWVSECQGCGSCRPRKLKSSKGNWFWTSGWNFGSNWNSATDAGFLTSCISMWNPLHNHYTYIMYWKK